MTAGQAIEQADELRPNNQFTDSLGADVNWNEGLEYETVLLAPEAFCPLYVHWLCAQMDLALGETARAMNELQVYSDYLQEFAVWMRKRYAPAAGAQWRY